jgi:hypothetical protein
MDPKNMKFLQEVDYEMRRNFHVDTFVWITTECELKFKYRSEF